MNNKANKYQKIRNAALKKTQEEFEEYEPDFAGHVHLTLINNDALTAQHRWDIADNREIGWEWDKVVQKYRKDYVARVELAIWYKEELCGLMIGKASNGRLVVKINYIQGGKAENPLKGFIVPISSRCAELFAVAIDASWIGIQDPIEDKDLIDYYRELGFNEADPFDPRNKALFKKLDINED